ncbi:MAG: FAD-dependent monooxygenase [Burkholderiales bacterium]|jgi:2-octaprenyl-6-methoxyphenol hydroxylase|nr:FAD-dependent monooxygenase [Burkholderiales bacterium]
MHDLIVVGGGPVGLVLAAAAGARGLDVQVLEADPNPDTPARALAERSLALSHASWRLLDRVGVAGRLDAASAPIRTVHISQRGHGGRCALHAADAGVDVLGRVVAYGPLRAALRDVAKTRAAVHDGVRVVGGEMHADHVVVRTTDGSVDARAVALADGGGGADAALGFAHVERDHGVHAIAARVRVDAADRGVAWERFDAHGPIALLPCDGGEHALIWVVPPDTALALSMTPDAAFLDALQRRFGWRAGRFTAVRDRRTWPLVSRTATSLVRDRAVLLGNAAQTLHPVAGQGLNLGLRDAWTLAQACTRDSDPALALARHGRARRLDRALTIGFTDTLAGLFVDATPGLAPLRGAGLAVLDTCGPLRRAAARALAVARR